MPKNADNTAYRVIRAYSVAISSLALLDPSDCDRCS